MVLKDLNIRSKDSLEIWFKPLVKGDWAMCFLNRSLKPQKVSFNWHNEAVTDSLSGRNAQFDNTLYNIEDLWNNKNNGTTKEALNAVVPAHDVLILRLKIEVILNLQGFYNLGGS